MATLSDGDTIDDNLRLLLIKLIELSSVEVQLVNERILSRSALPL